MNLPLWAGVALFTWHSWSPSSVLFAILFLSPIAAPRCFAVPNERAAQVVATILEHFGGLPPRCPFDSGPTHQPLRWDNTTVPIHFDQGATMGLP